MNRTNTALFVGVLLLLTLAACGPAGPALGLGPALDPIFGTVLLIVIVAGGLWAVKSVVQSPAGQTIERQVSKTGRSLRDHLDTHINRHADDRDRSVDAASSAEEILRERYAQGEIDRKQFLEMLDDLKRR